jgi:hypothetical protein
MDSINWYKLSCRWAKKIAPRYIDILGFSAAFQVVRILSEAKVQVGTWVLWPTSYVKQLHRTHEAVNWQTVPSF